jgi:hypothetical protein
VATFVQDRRTLEQGLFNQELPAEEFTQVKMGKIVRDLYPHLTEEDQEAVRQHAIAAINVVQGATRLIETNGENGAKSNTALIDGVRRFAMDVRELDIDLIDRINPFSAAYAVLAKAMNEERLRQVKAIIEAKRVNLTEEEARDLAKRALKFKSERGRLPSIMSPDAWEKRLAEGVAFLAKLTAKKKKEVADG